MSTMTFTDTARPRHRTSALTRLADSLGVWRQRRQLSQLDDHLLADLGLTRAEALAESRRPIWNVPANWRR